MTIIEIRDKLAQGHKLAELPLHVTFYGRVSTDMDEQLSSLTHQVEYFSNKIKENPNWTYCEGYIDEGITGTSVKKRKAFLQMIDDAKDGLFDLILTKEVSRFARDIVDSIQYTRELLKHNVGVFFEDIGLNTMEPDAEFRLSIMATVAQEESRKISTRVKFGYKQSNKNGVRHGGDAPTGYIFNNENNGYNIDPEKSKMIQYLFDRYSQDKIGLRHIAAELFQMGFKSKQGNPYSTQTLRRLIRHPVYTGNIVNGKSWTESYRDNNIIAKPQNEWIIVHDEQRVPPLVSQDVWDKCNAILESRGQNQIGINAKVNNTKGTHKYAYSGKIICDQHSKIYHHTRQQVRGDGSCSDYYRCPNYKMYGTKGCNSPYLYTKDLNRMMRYIFREIGSEHQQEAFQSVFTSIKKAMESRRDSNELAKLSGQRDALLAKKQKLINGWLNSIVDDFSYKKLSNDIDNEITTLDNRIIDIEKANISIEQTEEQMKTLCVSLSSIIALEDDSVIEMLVRRYLKQIRIIETDNAGTYVLEVHLHGREEPISGGIKQKNNPIQIPSLMEHEGYSMYQKGIKLFNFDFDLLPSIKPSVFNRSLEVNVIV